MGWLAAVWPGIGVLAWGGGAIACAIVAIWLRMQRGRFGPAHDALVAALALTAAWALAASIVGGGSPAASAAEALRNLSWLFALYRLFEVDGRHASMKPVRPLLAALAFVEMLALILSLALAFALPEAAGQYTLRTFALFRLLVAIGGLVLAQNLYGGASGVSRLSLRWPGLAVAAILLFDLNYYTIAYLSDALPEGLTHLRGATALAVAGLLAFGTSSDSDALRFRPSRAVAFRSASLLLIGGYLVAMVGIAQGLAWSGGDLALAMQRGFVAVASLAAIVVLPSARLRGWLRVMLTKHLFQHRYDYRSEWLRFTRTIGQGGADTASLGERAIRSIADITDSTAGLLLVSGERGQLELAARWQWPMADVPAEAMSPEQVRPFETAGYVADLDEIRAGRDGACEVPVIPDWLLTDPRAWALVPLLHYERLVGMVVLARPPHRRRLDWEDFDLLRVVGRQLASYLAENAGQEALAEAGRFDEFNRRIAFVMHDVKNLASQLGLLARNAEQHAENPAFRKDMLVTLRNSADKLNALLARLSRYGSPTVDTLDAVEADLLAVDVLLGFRSQHEVVLVEHEPCLVAGRRQALEQVLVHLVQNAIDATPAEAPVFIRVAVEGPNGVIEVTDTGEGMSPEFVRSRLFKPFDSTKSGGFGIGAYEARELVRAMRGRLDVESREGVGSRFTIRLPLAQTAELIDNLSRSAKDAA